MNPKGPLGSSGNARECLAGTRTQWRARGERARAHAEAWAEGWRDVAEHIAAAGAAAVVADWASRVGAQPVTAGVAGRIDTLHGEAGQELHEFSPSGRLACIAPGGQCGAPLSARNVGANCGASRRWCQEERPQDIGVGLPNLQWPNSERSGSWHIRRFWTVEKSMPGLRRRR